MNQQIEDKRYFQFFLVALILSLPFLWLVLARALGFSAHLSPTIQIALATIIQFWLGFLFYQEAYKAIMKKKLNYALLIALGTTTLYLYSLIFQNPDTLYFESSSLIITLSLLGLWLHKEESDPFFNYYFIFILLVTCGTLIGWSAYAHWKVGMINGLAVLMIACPSTLTLFHSIIIRIMQDLAGKKGIAFRDLSVLKKVAKMKVFCLDKSAFLAKGIPMIQIIVSTEEEKERELLQLTGSLAKYLDNSLAKAIMEEAEAENIEFLPVEELEIMADKGIKGSIHNKIYFLGSFLFAKEHAMVPHPIIDNIKASQTPLFIWTEGRLLGMICFANAIRKTSQEAISELKNRKINPILLTSERKETAESIADIVNIQDVCFELTREEKNEKIVQMVENNIGVIGLTLETPSVIHFGSNKEADVVLIRGDLLGVVDAVDLSRSFSKKMKLNLFFTYFYNIISLPLAVAGLLTPAIVLGTIAMGTISVVANSLFLYRFSLVRRKQ